MTLSTLVLRCKLKNGKSFQVIPFVILYFCACYEDNKKLQHYGCYQNRRKQTICQLKSLQKQTRYKPIFKVSSTHEIVTTDLRLLYKREMSNVKKSPNRIRMIAKIFFCYYIAHRL